MTTSEKNQSELVVAAEAQKSVVLPEKKTTARIPATPAKIEVRLRLRSIDVSTTPSTTHVPSLRFLEYGRKRSTAQTTTSNAEYWVSEFGLISGYTPESTVAPDNCR